MAWSVLGVEGIKLDTEAHGLSRCNELMTRRQHFEVTGAADGDIYRTHRFCSPQTKLVLLTCLRHTVASRQFLRSLTD